MYGNRAKIITPRKFEKATGIKLTHHSDDGKLSGFRSLNTSCLCNARCAHRIANAVAACENEFGKAFVKKHPKKAFSQYVKNHPNACICGGCFASSLIAQYKPVGKNVAKNTEILTSREIPVEDWPLVNDIAFRFESFGDVANVVQVRNYFNFARRNPRTTFTVWTKNPDIYARAIAGGAGKPKNLIIILSSVQIGRRADAAKWPFVDKIFTVYANAEQARAAGVEINCGGRKCLDCMRCYTRGGVKIINELLK